MASTRLDSSSFHKVHCFCSGTSRRRVSSYSTRGRLKRGVKGGADRPGCRGVKARNPLGLVHHWRLLHISAL